MVAADCHEPGAASQPVRCPTFLLTEITAGPITEAGAILACQRCIMVALRASDRRFRTPAAIQERAEKDCGKGCENFTFS